MFLHRLPAVQRKAVVQDAELQMEEVRQKVVSQLSFSIATPFKFDRGRDKSQPFYAVILSAPICKEKASSLTSTTSSEA